MYQLREHDEMNFASRGTQRLMIAVAAGLTFACVVALSTLVTAGELPMFAKVSAIVDRHFATLPEHQPGDLISQSQVAPVFEQLETLGWKVADRSTIYNSVLPDSNYLVETFRKPDGRKFMRKISGDKLAYDRLDQLSRMPGGKLMMQDFLRFPNADISLTGKSAVPIRDYARFAPPRDRSRTPTAADLDKPTKRIYTTEQLLARLQESYNTELHRRKQAK